MSYIWLNGEYICICYEKNNDFVWFYMILIYEYYLRLVYFLIIVNLKMKNELDWVSQRRYVFVKDFLYILLFYFDYIYFILNIFIFF